ncbi:MAG: hypothetical protein U1F65_05895 [Verrucomicrobiota bacterium]
MRFLKYIIYGSAPKTMVIKAKAHLFTVLASVWFVFSLLGVMFFRESRAPDEWIGVTIAIVIWSFHATFVGLAVYFWITEKPKEVLIIQTGADIGD